jgi:hypothetical protein
MMIDIVFEYICPVLIMLWIISGPARLAGVTVSSGPAGKGILLLFSLALALYPVRGLSVSHYMLSLNPAFSIGSIALLLIIVCNRIWNRNLVTDKDLKHFVIWNIFISLSVFIPALGFTGLDIYALGYGSGLLFAVMALVTIFLVYQKSPLSYIFIAYIAAFNLKLLPSENFFDYITDGVLFFISLGMLFTRSYRTRNTVTAT